MTTIVRRQPSVWDKVITALRRLLRSLVAAGQSFRWWLLGASMCLMAPRVDSVVCPFLCVCASSLLFCLASWSPWISVVLLLGRRFLHTVDKCKQLKVWVQIVAGQVSIGLQAMFSKVIYISNKSVDLWRSDGFRNLLAAFVSCMSFSFSFFLSLLLLLVPLLFPAHMQTPHLRSLRLGNSKLHLYIFIKFQSAVQGEGFITKEPLSGPPLYLPLSSNIHLQIVVTLVEVPALRFMPLLPWWQEKYQRKQQKLKEEWEKAQREVAEEGRKYHEEVKLPLFLTSDNVPLL